MIDLGDLAGGEADLVAVGGVAFGSDLADLFLGKLAGQGFGKGCERIARAGDAHRLIDVGAAGEGIADAAAEAGGRATERLDLGGVVVGLVFELDEPFLGNAGRHGGDLEVDGNYAVFRKNEVVRFRVDHGDTIGMRPAEEGFGNRVKALFEHVIGDLRETGERK